jgi:hypothetical protein
MKLNYRASNFPNTYPQLQGENNFTFTTSELLWAAITVGRKGWDFLQHGQYSIYEIIYRIGLVKANLILDDRVPKKSEAYKSLDPSEKSAISYFLGLTMCKLMASKCLETHSLLHVDVYKEKFEEQHIPISIIANRRPDLIGQNENGDWLVFEAKGRTNRYNQELLNSAKEQSRQITSVGDIPPIMAIASVAYFSGDYLRLIIVDPEPEEDGLRLEMDEIYFNKNYYNLFFNLDKDFEKPSSENEDYRYYHIESLDITIGVLKSILASDASFNNNFQGQIAQEVKIYEGLQAASDFDEESPIDRQEMTDPNRIKKIEPERPSEDYEEENVFSSDRQFNGRDGISVILGESWN